MIIFVLIMAHAQSTYLTQKLLKWFFAASLLLSIFTLSGYVGNFTSLSKDTAQRECVFYKYNRTERRTVAYKRIIAAIPFQHSLFSIKQTDVLLAHNARIKVTLNAVSRIFYFHAVGQYFLHEKTIPQSSDEDIFLINIG